MNLKRFFHPPFFAVAVAAALALSACASSTTGQIGPSTGPIGGPVSAYSGPLAGASPAQVQSQLGKPNIVRDEGNGALWTYRFPTCALMVGFTGPNSGRRVTAVEPGPREAGQSTPSREACIAEARR
ncbi:MAG: hypothetical protein ABWZ40_14785 [Caulobacterales bacterium]